MKREKILTAALALTLTASMFAGCGDGDKSSASESSAATASGSSSESTPVGYNGKDNLKVTETPSEISLFYAFAGNGAPKGDMPIWKKAAEITNVTMKNVANESISDDQQSFNTMLASGELPDLIQAQRIILDPAIAQGALIPLDDLIEQYAPNIQKFLSDFPDAVNAGTGTDGKFYSVSGTLGGEPGKTVASMGFFIRQDWLDKLKLEAPTTLEEYKNVLYAFRNDDPNGNGKKDEVPFFYRDKGVWPLLQLWGGHNSWFIGADDKVHYGLVEPEYKTALTELTQWYKDGVIDSEIFTRGSQSRQFLLGNDIGGATIDWFSSTGAVNDAVRAQVPNINFAAITPPADVNGKVKIDQGRSGLHAYAWGISKDCKDPVAAIKYMDFFFSDTGSLLYGYGIEGEDYTMVDGKPVPSEKALTNSVGYPNYMRSIGTYEIGSYGNLNGEISAMNKQAKDGFQMYNESTWVQKPFPTMTFTVEERATIDANMTNITASITEYEQSCLMGTKQVDTTWDAHVAELNKMNLQAILDAYNSAYVRYKAAK